MVSRWTRSLTLELSDEHPGSPLIADTLARLMQLGPRPRVARNLTFTELPARTAPVTIPTGHGDVQAVVYSPEDPAGRPCLTS